MTSISIQSLVKRFGQVAALDDVSLEIAPGELFFLLGPSGCGKTTLLRSLAGFYIPDSGRIRFGDRDVTQVPPQKRDTGMVFQNYALWPHMTVEANVAFGLRVRRLARGEVRRRTGEALEIVRMNTYARRKPNQLSGGQQQRVALARALAVRPRCLLLDEPLSNLDAKLRLDMRGEIRRICKQFGLTAVYVTHDQKEALTVADRMAVMFTGRVAQVGAPGDLYRRPTSPAVADFLGETNFIAGQSRTPENGLVVLDTEIGTVRAAGDVATPGSYTLSIRPEAFVLDMGACASRNGALNHIRGRVLERLYLGEGVQLTVGVREGRLRVNVVERAGIQTLDVGAEVDLALDPRDIVVLH
jgi:iron(III) transport system ATP-binding protein